DSRSPLRRRVVELYVRRSEVLAAHSNEDASQICEARLGIDNELSAFLSRHVDVDNGARSCAEAQLWRSATLLAQRHKASQANVLRVLIRNAPNFPKHCSLLYLISAMYIISDKAAWTQVREYDAACRSISCGMNGSAAITAEGQLLIWGDFTNQQNKPFESIEMSGKTTRRSSTETPLSPKRSRPQQLPHPIHVEGRPRVVCCGAEHILVLTSAGRLFSLGRNRFGQCGVGHSLPVPELQLVEGNWGSVRALSAGQFHSAILNTKGEVWTFGWGVWGQLGIGGRQIKDCLVPTKVPGLTIAFHGLDFQLGHGNKTERSEPHILFDPRDVKWKLVACGGNHTIGVSKDGRTFGWGRNDYAQCGVPSDKTPSLTKKYFYQAQKQDGAGAAKRCVSLPDDASFVVKPTLIPEVELRFYDEDSVSTSFDQKQLMTRLRGCDLPTIQAVSRHFLCRHPVNAPSSKSTGLDASVPIALVHLMAGNVLAAIEQIGRARNATPDAKVDAALRSVAGLAWEVVANHEDCQSKSILSAAFKYLPITNTQKRNSQLRRLWPMVSTVDFTTKKKRQK
ncbi:hypothetical protein COOONC_11024, partial [Cooperia oncophora]